jgi:hypothetical protein
MRANAKSLATFLCFFALNTQPAVAQYFSGPLSSGAFETTINMGPIARTLQQGMQGMDDRRTSSTKVTRSLPPDSFRYKPSKPHRAANLASFIARSRAVNPDSGKDLAQFLGSRDIIEEMRGPLAKYGLRIDNLADAVTVWWIGAWQASRGSTDDPSQAATTAVRQQVTRSLAAVPDLVAADNSLKQTMSEAFLLQALLLGVALEQAKGEPAQTRAIGGAATQGAQRMGLDLAAVTLTDEGFQLVK